MLPIYLRALELLKDISSEFTVVIHVAPNKDVEEYIRDIVGEWPVRVVLLPGGSPCMKYNAFSVSDLLVQVGFFSYWLLLALLKTTICFAVRSYINYPSSISYMM